MFNYRWIASFYRSKHYPLAFQIFLVLVLVVFIYDGFVGPESADENLITLSLSGFFWYPVVFGSLFFAGRWWCAVCPVGAIAGAANRFNIGVKFPRKLSNWGLPLLSFVIPLWGFREFDINVLREPLITAVWITGVIVVAIVTSIIFQGRVFCKYMCPISAPLAVMSRVAPVEVRTKTMATHVDMSNKKQGIGHSMTTILPVFNEGLRNDVAGNTVGVGKIDPSCKSCKTHDCYNGNEITEGCPWEEHPATMTSNSACSMCMKCTHSCPVTEPMRLRLRVPFAELWQVFRPNIYEAFTVLVLIAIFNTFLWYETVDLLFPGFKENILESTQAALPFLSEKQIDRGVIRYIMSIGLVIGLYAIASLVSSKLSRQKVKPNFSNFAYAYLAAFFVFALIGSTIGQLFINGNLYLMASLQQLGIYLYVPPFMPTGLQEFPVKTFVEPIIAIIVASYIVLRISSNMFNEIRKQILASIPHIVMIIFLVLIFTTIQPRWS